MRDNVNILEKYTENLIVKKNLLQTTVDAYKLDINEYLEFLKKRDIDILDTDEKIFNEYFFDVEKNYKKATFSRKYSTIRGLYKFLLKNRYIDKIFEYKLSVNKSDNKVTTKKNNIIFKQKEYEEFINSLSDNFNEMRLKLIFKMIVEYKINLVNIFEIQIKDLLKYDFQKIIIVRNNKIISYDIDKLMEEDLKNYYKKYAFEKRFLFGAYGKSTFISDLKRYNLDFKTLKNCMQEDEKDLIENIRKMYFEIGIGDLFLKPSEKEGNLLVLKIKNYDEIEKKVEKYYRCFLFYEDKVSLSYFDDSNIHSLVNIFTGTVIFENCTGKFLVDNNILKVYLKDKDKEYEEILYYEQK